MPDASPQSHAASGWSGAWSRWHRERRRAVERTKGLCQGGGGRQRCIRTEGASEAAPEAVRQAVGGGCRSGWGRLLSVANAVEAGTWRQGDSGWA